MKNLLAMIALVLCSVVANAKTYYVSTTGSDSNPGTEAAPFKNWEKLSSVMVAGDIAYIHGGTYLSTKGAGGSVHCYWQNMHGTATSLITIQNYPGEKPVLDLSNLGVPTYSDPSGVYLKSCSYLYVKGLRVTGLQQNQSGSGISRGWEIDNSPNCKFELIEVDHIGGGAFHVYDNSNDTYFLNCDAHHNDDRYSSPSPWGGADGFSCTGGANTTRITFEGCRSWWNSDDGWDNFKTDGLRTWKNCWAFWNGYEPGTFTARGNGDGFKLGPANTDQSNNTIRFLQNCISFENLTTGFDQNGTPTMLYQLYNNTAYGNHSDGFNLQYSASNAAQTLKNNASYNNSSMNFRYVGANNNITNNTWNGAVTVNASDFMSTSSSGVDGARQADGSLPALNYLKLQTGSDLINAGINIGLSFLSAAPDMGAFESGAAGNTPPTANAGADQTITLPASTATLTGSGTDIGGSIAAYAWSIVSGPGAGTISSPTAATTSVTGLAQGAYTFQLKVTDNSGSTATDNVIVTVNPAVITNTPPTANAGADQTITLPASTVTLTGSGTDVGGSISAYAWSKVSGPAAGTIASPAAATTSITGLTQGAYTFQLKVTDNGGLTATDNIIVTVNAAGSTTTAKAIKVNVYTSVVYSNTQWNNWASSAAVTSSAFKYTEGTASTVKAVFSKQKKIQDNGSGYLSTATICPPEVLRYGSAYQGQRTINFTGLSTSKQYTFELYASASVSGSSTKFSIGTAVSTTVNTYNNKTAVARFINLTPNALGMVTFTITNTSGWNYVNGFAITEQTGSIASRVTAKTAAGAGDDNDVDCADVVLETDASLAETADTEVKAGVTVFPLPFSTSFTVSLYGEATGLYNLTLIDVSGKTVWKKQVNKTGAAMNETIYMGNLAAGSYILQVISPDEKQSAYPIIKN